MAQSRFAGRGGKLIVVVAIGAYVAAMLLPAYRFSSGTLYVGGAAFGNALLFAGPWGLVAWLANPLLWVSVLLLAMRRGGSWPIVLAMLAFTCSLLGVMLWLQTQQGSDVVEVLPGVYAWIASFPLIGLGAEMRHGAMSASHNE